MLFDSLTIVTLAPGMTPCASLTTPRNPPWKDWATRGADETSAATRSQAAERTIRMGPPDEDGSADSYTFLCSEEGRRRERQKGGKAGRQKFKAGRQKAERRRQEGEGRKVK